MKARTLFVLLALASLGLGIARHYVAIGSSVAAEGVPKVTQQTAATEPAANEWPLFRGNSLGTGVAHTSLPAEPALLWKFPVEDGSFESTAVIANNVAYIGDLDGTFYALGLNDGKELWRFKSPSAAGFNASAAIRLASANADPASPQPQATADSPSSDAPTADTATPDAVASANESAPAALLFVGNMDGEFFCLDAKTGEQKWSFKTEAEINSSPNFYKDFVLVGSQDATLYCLKAETGELVWKHAIEDQIRCMPAVIENRAFLAGCDGRLHIIDLDKGEAVSDVQIDAPTGSTPAIAGTMVYFGTEGGTFFGINWKEASVAWKFRDSKRNQPFRASAAVTDNALFVGGRDKSIRSLNAQTGEEIWNFPTRGRVDSSPVVVGERMYAGSADGRIYGLNTKTGEKEWEYEAGGSFTASPAVADGRLVISSDDGIVYCFGAK